VERTTQERAPKRADQLSPGRKPWVKWGIQPSPVGTAQARTHVHESVAIVTAMRTELAPLLRGKRAQQVDGVELFEMDSAVVALSGIGKKAARRATEAVIRHVQPELLVSAGIAGAVSPKLKVGDVGWARDVVDAETGVRYRTRGGDWLLVTAQAVAGPAEKREFLQRYGADIVDMESAAVASVALEHGLEFAVVKAISEEADFVMPPLSRFVQGSGRFATGRFMGYVALRPQLWPAVSKLRANSRVASVHLSSAVEHLIGEYSTSPREENVPLA
jgi:adenosylhomocysteine nucleosidase